MNSKAVTALAYLGSYLVVVGVVGAAAYLNLIDHSLVQTTIIGLVTYAAGVMSPNPLNERIVPKSDPNPLA